MLILYNVGVMGSDCGMLSKIVLCKVMGIIRLRKYGHFGTCLLLKVCVHIFLDIKHVHSACVADSLSLSTG
jgi:hypothetical protein